MVVSSLCLYVAEDITEAAAAGMSSTWVRWSVPVSPGACLSVRGPTFAVSVRREPGDGVRQAVAGADRGQLSVGFDVPSEDAVCVRVDRVQIATVAGKVLVPQAGVRLDGGAGGGVGQRQRSVSC